MSLRSRRLARPLIAVALCIGLILAAVSALADRPSSDRSVATQILTQFQTDTGPAASSLARPIGEARSALARADNAIGSGDAVHARLLEGLARQWAELALDMSRAAQAQADAGALEQSAADASMRVQRARAMLDELAARKARSQGELNQLSEQADGGAAKATAKPASVGKPTAVIAVPSRAPAKSAPTPKSPSSKGSAR